MSPICHVFRGSKVNPELLTNLTRRLEESFSTVQLKVPETIHVLDPDPKCFDKRRRQYRADDLVDYCVETAEEKRIYVENYAGGKQFCLYLMADDCYDGSLNFVFGLGKHDFGSLVCLYRLENDVDFIFKECVHEIGHVFKLKHCTLPCVMTFSNSVSEAHQKNMTFCDKCAKKLKENE